MDRHHTRPSARPDEHVDGQLAHRLALPAGARPAIWRVPPPQQPGCLSPELAQLLLDSHTRPGDVVLDIDDDIAFAATAAAAARRHHALGGARHLAEMSHAAGYLDLILLHWPRPAVNPRWLLTACRSLLGATGRLAIAVGVDSDQRDAHLSALTGAAAAVRLHTVRHVAALGPASTPNAIPDAAPRSATGVATRRGANDLRRHPDAAIHPHTDLLILGGVNSVKATGDE